MMRLYVLYDYVQRCEDTVSVELCYIRFKFIIIIISSSLLSYFPVVVNVRASYPLCLTDKSGSM